MDIKNLKDALKLHKEFTAKITESVEVLNRTKKPDLKAVLKEKRQLVKQVGEELKLAVKERDSIIGRLDERVKRYKAQEARQTEEIKTLEDKLKEPPKKTTPSRRKTTLKNR